MTLAQRIKEYRTRLQLTQEELAKQLHVSHAAVSKWETGATSPDLKILPSLARTLHTDVNTLLDFTSEVSDEDIALFLNEVSEVANGEYSQAHEMVKEKLREYPHCDKLRYSCAMVLYGGLMREAVSGFEQYRDELISWMKDVSESFDHQIRYGAKQFLIGVYRNEKQFDQAEALLEELPNLSGIDPERMRVMLEKDRGNLTQAEVLCENMLLSQTNRLFMGLELLLELRCDLKEVKQAKQLAKRMKQFAQVMELWEYYACMGDFYVAMNTKNERNMITSLKQLLKACEKPWDIRGGLLYPHVKTKPSSKEFSDMIKQEILQSLLTEEQGNSIKENPEFIQLCQEHGIL